MFDSMMFHVLVIAITWGLAPMLGGASGLNPKALAVMVAIGTLIAAVPSMGALAGGSARSISFGGGAGILNGIGLLSFYALVAGGIAGKWDMSVALGSPLGLVPVVIMLGSYFFFGEVISTTKAVGVLGLGFSIYLMNQ